MEDFYFNSLPLPLVCVKCGFPAWVNAMKEDGSGGVDYCTICHEITTLRRRTEAEQAIIHARILNEMKEYLKSKE